MPLPEHERVPVDLTRHLVANEQPPQVATSAVDVFPINVVQHISPSLISAEMEVVESQTDEFLPEPPPEPYQPQRTLSSGPGHLSSLDTEM